MQIGLSPFLNSSGFILLKTRKIVETKFAGSSRIDQMGENR